ncbi:uncharacterized protein IUM83_01378 [Phytophthora cinnamomi]|uniref:uncharacterized protein n=1 Tax=Phytophthora cinnamomi TaxID=4785 RepID=UPI003559D2B4|nr:hypothetical protein IUM83_01378 [Phytophthora cinnamomi]
MFCPSTADTRHSALVLRSPEPPCSVTHISQSTATIFMCVAFFLRLGVTQPGSSAGNANSLSNCALCCVSCTSFSHSASATS